MNKIFKYELKRLLLNKLFFGMLVIIGFVSWQTLRNDVILGIANTAPFSPWSFGYYLSRDMPLLLIGVLLVLHSFFSYKEQQVSKLTKATAVKQSKYMAVRYGAAIVSYLLLGACAVIIYAGFCGTIFNFTSFQFFVVPLIITILPAILFFMGMGIWVEQIKPNLVYGVMALVIILALSPLPYSLDLIGANFFSKYPMGLKTLDPEFVIPLSVLLGKCAYSIIGILLIATSLYKQENEGNVAN